MYAELYITGDGPATFAAGTAEEQRDLVARWVTEQTTTELSKPRSATGTQPR